MCTLCAIKIKAVEIQRAMEQLSHHSVLQPMHRKKTVYHAQRPLLKSHNSGVTKVAPHAAVPKMCSLGYKDNVDVAVE